MPSRSPAAMLKKSLNQAAKRKQYRDMKDQAQTISLQQQHLITKSTPAEFFDTIQFQEIDLSANLTLLDLQSQEVILQKISPTSHRKALEAQASCKTGKDLFDKYCLKKGTASTLDPTRHSVGHHLGIWHDQANFTLDFTRETLKPAYKKEAIDLLAWARKHTDNILLPARNLYHPRYLEHLSQRLPSHLWLSSFFGDRAVSLVHPWYSTTAFFHDFSSGYHVDKHDTSPSFLFNFGQPVWIEFPEFAAKVKIQPLDLVLLNSRSYWHRTAPIDETSSSGRWAFSAFLRSSIFEMRPVSKISASRLDSIFS